MPPLHQQARFRNHATLVGFDAMKRTAWNVANWYEFWLLSNPLYLWLRLLYL